jgi:hypothetical protein
MLQSLGLQLVVQLLLRLEPIARFFDFVDKLVVLVD